VKGARRRIEDLCIWAHTCSSCAYHQDLLLLLLVLHIPAHVEARLGGLSVEQRLSVWHSRSDSRVKHRGECVESEQGRGEEEEENNVNSKRENVTHHL